jgi:hypothetical protein
VITPAHERLRQVWQDVPGWVAVTLDLDNSDPVILALVSSFQGVISNYTSGQMDISLEPFPNERGVSHRGAIPGEKIPRHAPRLRKA